MGTTKIKFSPSINIVRDNNYSFNYIPTKNAGYAFNTLLNDTIVGIKSHVLIGAYGTGKSSFLLALKQTLEGTNVHFKGFAKLLNSIPNYEFISIVGEYASFESYFAKYFQLGRSYNTNDIIKSLDKHYRTCKKKGTGLAIIVDEFGKFLEYAAKNNPESELYFIQQLAEWANDVSNDTFFISTLHQDFSAYAHSLSKIQRQEWDKVKGRIKDIPFNEPVEQLLFLASERVSQIFAKVSLDKSFDNLFKCIKEANAFPLKDYFEISIAKKLYPFDILSSAVLTLSLQKYGQNERSLFSFIESNDHLGINEFDYKENGFYSIPRVYDYLINGYYSYLTTRYNPHYTQWTAIRRALERIEGPYNIASEQKQAEDIIKTIGLLNIFATASAKLEPKFYITYSKLALNIKHPEHILDNLAKKKIIRYVNHSFKYILFEGTDLDIEIAIDDAGRLVEKVTNVVNYLNQYFEFPFIAAKSVFYKKGTPRFFQFKLSEEPLKLVPEGEVDGFINLIFSENSKTSKAVEDCSFECKEAILYGYYKNSSEIKNLLFEIQKVKKVIETNLDDKIAIKELNSILEHYITLLNHFVIDNLYNDNGNIQWYFKGDKIKIYNRHHFNQMLSAICEKVYYSVPKYKNELLNKTKISGQIASSRKRLFDKLINELDLENIGFNETEFPPEKSIYLSLLQNTGIHQINAGVGILNEPNEKSFQALWNTSIKFLESTKNKERNLNDFINILSSRPFKLKQGFIDFWVPIFLLAKSDEYALYEDNKYLPTINSDVLDLMNKRPGLFSIKAFDVVGIKLELFNRYRVFLNQAENHRPTNKSFIQTIKPFLAFYRELPEYSKKTNRFNSSKTLSLRKVIASAKDPEKAFFEDFPTALGYSIQEIQEKPEKAEKFIKELQKCIRELRTIHDELINRFEDHFIHDIIGSKLEFPDYKNEIQLRFNGLKNHLLLPHQKTFYSRIQSSLDDRKAWLSSVAQACINKPITSITDEDEELLFDKIKDTIYELDNLSEISKERINSETEEVLKLEITSFVQGLNKNMLRIPKEKNTEIQAQIQKIKSNLGKDKKMNIAVLTKLLQELLQNE